MIVDAFARQARIVQSGEVLWQWCVPAPDERKGTMDRADNSMEDGMEDDEDVLVYYEALVPPGSGGRRV